MKYFLPAIALCAPPALAHDHTPPAQPGGGPEPHVRYIENQGQWPASVLFKTDLPEAAMFLERDGITWSRYEPGSAEKVHELNHQPESARLDLSLKGHAWKIHFVGGNTTSVITTEDRQAYYLNFFLGNDPAKWAGNVPVFHGMTYHDLWPGIDLRWHGAEAQIKYDVLIAAGADASVIAFRYEGLDGVDVNGEGDLVLRTSIGEFMEMKPVAWYADNHEPLVCTYKVKDGVVRFHFPQGVDDARAVVIDPLLIGATYSGAVTSSNYGHCATYDDDGHMYGGAQNFGVGFPATAGAFQTAPGSGTTDIVVNKFSADATALIWATYIGGPNDEKPHSMIVNAAQQLSILGSCTGAGYPTSAGAYQPASGGGTDIVLTRLNTAASALVGSTYLGGSAQDGRQDFTMTINYGDTYRGEIMLDASDNIWIASCTQSANFPITAGAFQSAIAGGQDGAVCGLTGNLTTLLHSTYLGGTTGDNALGLRFNSAGDLFVCGGTTSANFPMAGGGYQNTYQGGDKDAYIVKFTGGVTTLAYSTFFGTAGEDIANFIDLDNDEDVYIYGQSDGGVAIDPPGIYGQAGGNIFIAQFDPTLASTIFTTALGTGGFGYALAPVAFLVDVCEHIYISGYNPASTWATTPNALYGYTGSQFYLAAYDVDMVGLLFGTYYGGSHVDGGTSRFDKNGIIYQAVCSGGNSMPTSAGSYAPTNNVGWDLGQFKIDFQVAGVNAAGASTINSGCAPILINFSNTSTGTNWIWDFGDGSPLDTAYAPSHTYTTAGAYTVMLIAYDSLACNLADTTYLPVTIGLASPITAAFTISQSPDCTISQISTTNTSTGAPLAFVWDMGDGSPLLTDTNVTHVYAGPGLYNVELLAYDPTGCSQPDSITIPVIVNPPLQVTAAFTATQVPDCSAMMVFCDNQTVSPLPNFFWDMGDGTTYTTYDVTHTYAAPGTYTITMIVYDLNTCNYSDTLSMQVTLAPPDPVYASFTVDQTFDCAEMVAQTVNTSTGSFLLFEWDMGDGTLATTFDVTHTYTVPGTYDITLVVHDSLGCSPSDTATAQVTIDPLVPVFAAFSTEQVGSCLDLAVEATNLSTGDSVSYSWDMGDGTVYNTFDVAHVYTAPGAYTITLTITDLGCGQDDVATLTIDVIQELPTALVPDTVLCFGTTVVLDGTSPGVTDYLWSTGETTPQITIDEGGTYFVEVFTPLCQGTDTVNVVEGTDPELSFELVACPSEPIWLTVPMAGQSYAWSTGGDEQTEYVIGDGVYVFSVIDFLGCPHTDTATVKPLTVDAQLFAPNAFTPDGDGVNDVFAIAGYGEEAINLMIFDRWGEHLYTTTDLSKPWDGVYNGGLVKTDVYVYKLTYNSHCDLNNEKTVIGHVSVLH